MPLDKWDNQVDTVPRDCLGMGEEPAFHALVWHSIVDINWFFQATDSQEDAKRGPHLPGDAETAANEGRWVLRRIHRHRRSLGAHADAQQKAADEQLPPVAWERPADHRDQTEDGREEDGTASAKVEIERIRNPAAAATVMLYHLYAKTLMRDRS